MYKALKEIRARLDVPQGNWFRGEFHSDNSWMRRDMIALLQAVEKMRYSLVIISDAAKTDGDLCVKEALKTLEETKAILEGK